MLDRREYLRDSWEVLCKDYNTASEESVQALSSKFPEHADLIRMLSIYYRTSKEDASENRMRIMLSRQTAAIEELRAAVA